MNGNTTIIPSEFAIIILKCMLNIFIGNVIKLKAFSMQLSADGIAGISAVRDCRIVDFLSIII